MNYKIHLLEITEDPVIRHLLCSFAAANNTSGNLTCIVNVLTEEVSFEIVKRISGIEIMYSTCQSIAQAVQTYNSITP